MRVPVTKPNIVWDDVTKERFESVVSSGYLTNGQWVSRFEEEAAAYLGVQDTVAVSSGTAGLMLLLRACALPGVRPRISIPSFTFTASAEAALWAGWDVDLLDSDPASYMLDDDIVGGAHDDSFVMGVHIFGAPCSLEHPRVVYDAAHALGGFYDDGRRVGSRGIAEVFSFSPTKLMTTGEGGLVATNDPALAESVRALRNYGNRRDYHPVGIGLNARMTEFAAVLGLAALPLVDDWVQERQELVSRYKENLKGSRHIGFQSVRGVSTYKDFSIRLPLDVPGWSRAEVRDRLASKGIDSRAYFDPSLHDQTNLGLPVPDVTALASAAALSERLLCVPLFNGMGEDVCDEACDAILSAPEVG